MARNMSRLIAAGVAAALAVTVFDSGSAQAAPVTNPQAQSAEGLDLSARKRHRTYRSYRNDRAAVQMFGMVASMIASVAAAQEARRYHRRYRYDGYYDYPPPRYYGYGPYYRY